MREARAQLVQDRAHNSKVRLAIGQCASGDCRVVTQNPTEHLVKADEMSPIMASSINDYSLALVC